MAEWKWLWISDFILIETLMFAIMHVEYAELMKESEITKYRCNKIWDIKGKKTKLVNSMNHHWLIGR